MFHVLLKRRRVLARVQSSEFSAHPLGLPPGLCHLSLCLLTNSVSTWYFLQWGWRGEFFRHKCPSVYFSFSLLRFPLFESCFCVLGAYLLISIVYWSLGIIKTLPVKSLAMIYGLTSTLLDSMAVRSAFELYFFPWDIFICTFFLILIFKQLSRIYLSAGFHFVSQSGNRLYFVWMTPISVCCLSMWSHGCPHSVLVMCRGLAYIWHSYVSHTCAHVYSPTVYYV